ncbi:MAG: cysteine desulfurase NifS [Candidatus Eiseniibacteriota bacterium]|nr:MAG: cysteine desulfurase NifS [Candidatus Eisenbacteria bacterium]
MAKSIYFDHAATTQTDERVVEAMLPFLRESFGNPSTVHDLGQQAKAAIDGAREAVAKFIGALPDEIVFTSTGTEADNFAIKGLAATRQQKGNHIITSSIEHHAVLHSCKKLEKQGFEVTYVPVDKYGMVDPGEVEKAVRPSTILISIMHANNEVGTVQPLEKISGVARAKKVVFHTDAVQTVGQIPVDVNKLGVDLLSLSGHQFYGPKGVGALYIRRGVRIAPVTDGGIQEDGKRPGTENVAAIVGLGKAAEVAGSEMAAAAERMKNLRDSLEVGIRERVNRVRFNGHPEKRLPGHASMCVEYVEGESMVLFLNMEGIAASSGSTCSSKALKSSHVLAAMGVPPAVAQGSLLLALGRENSQEEVDRFIEVFPPIVERLREMSPLCGGPEEKEGEEQGE